MQRWVRGVANGVNDADQTPPGDDLLPESDALGLTPGTPTDGTVAGTEQAAVVHGAADLGIDLDWLPEPGRTQAMSGRAAGRRRMKTLGAAPTTWRRLDALSLTATPTDQD